MYEEPKAAFKNFNLLVQKNSSIWRNRTKQEKDYNGSVALLVTELPSEKEELQQKSMTRGGKLMGEAEGWKCVNAKSEVLKVQSQ